MELSAASGRIDSGARTPQRRGLALRFRGLWAHQRRPLALALVAAAVATLEFGQITEDYLTNDPLVRWDVSFARWLSDHRSAAGVDFFRAVTDLGGPTAMLLFATVACIVLYRRRRIADAAFLVVALGVTELLNITLKLSFHRARPEVAFVHLDTYSYPSGHAMLATVTLGALVYVAWPALTGTGRVLAIAAAGAAVALISLSRLYLGVHYLSDVLGGLSAGAAWLALVIALRLLYGDAVAARLAGTRADRLGRALTRS